jgi:uncharacterized membrane protein YciS (DUF1049 family)
MKKSFLVAAFAMVSLAMGAQNFQKGDFLCVNLIMKQSKIKLAIPLKTGTC